REGVRDAHLYGADDKVLGGLNSFYLLVDRPETYGLPSAPKLPSRSVPGSAFWSIFTAIMTALGVLFAFRSRTKVGQDSNPVAANRQDWNPAPRGSASSGEVRP